MHTPNFSLLYVSNPTESAAFYGDILGRKPVESSPGFAMFVLDDGFKLGLWLKNAVRPPVSTDAGGSEMILACDSNDEVDRVHDAWKQKGIAILQPPETMEFGYTFTAADPDGHRLRVYCVSENPM
jgi:catechol 2,3-dioxygenase-like lactoylglutathione lyase family enzyme